jgi:hypothetical protein
MQSRKELRLRIQDALHKLDDKSREVLIRLKPPTDRESQNELKRFREEAKALIHN